MVSGSSSVKSVQPAISDHADCSFGNQKIKWTAGCGPITQVSAGNLERRNLDHPGIPAKELGLELLARREARAGAVHDDELAASLELIDAAPTLEISHDVGSDDQRQGDIGLIGNQLVHRVDREGRSPPSDLEIADLDSVTAMHGRLDEREPVCRWRNGTVAELLPWLVGNDKQYDIKLERRTGIDRGHEVSDVHGVEGSAEDSDTSAHHRSPVGSLEAGRANGFVAWTFTRPA